MTMSAEEKINELEQQLAETRAMAMNAMMTSSDLGLVVQFLKNSFTIQSYEELAQLLIDALEPLGLSAVISMETYAGRIFINPHNNDHHRQESEFLKQHLLCGRIVEEDDKLQINYDCASALVINIPDNEERRGQLRDNLALLMDGLEARVKSLILEEKASEAQQSKNEFFALMSHELRTPLNPIIGFATRLDKKLAGIVDEQSKRAIVSIKNNGESLLRLLNHIIDISALETGDIELHFHSFNVADSVDRALFKVEDLAEEKKTVIEKDIPRDMMLNADPARFIDIIISLCSYTIKAASNHTIKINARMINNEYGQEQFTLTIEDNASTMSEAYQTRIFDHFAERKVSSICESNDIGIGLYLTKKIVELHQGNIFLEAGENQVGNIFTVTLPTRR